MTYSTRTTALSAHVQRLLIALLLSTPLFISSLAQAQPQISAEQVEQSLAQLQKKPEQDQAQQAQLIDRYEQALALLKSKQEYQHRLQRLEDELRQTPRLLQQTQLELERTQPLNESSLIERYQKLLLSQLEEHDEALNEQRQVLALQLDQLNTQINTEQGLPGRAQNRLDQINATQIKNRRSLTTLQGLAEKTAQQKAEQTLLLSEQQNLEVERTLRRQQIKVSAQRLDLLFAQRTLAQEKHSNTSVQLQALQAELIIKRRNETEQTLEEIDELPQQAADFGQIRAENKQLGQQLLTLNDQQANLQQHAHQNSQLQQQVNQLEQAIEQQNIALEQSPELGRLLLAQRKSLPSLNLYSELDTQITTLRLEQFQLYRQRQALADIPQAIERLLNDTPAAAEPTHAQIEQLTEQLQMQRSLLDKKQHLTRQNFELAVEIKRNQRELEQQIKQLSQQIKQQLFLLPTSKPFSFELLAQIPTQLLADVHHYARYFDALRIDNELAKNPLQTLIALLLTCIVLHQRPRIHRRLEALAQRVGNVRQDSIWVTPEALGLQALLLLPVILPPIFIGHLLYAAADNSTQKLGLMLISASLTAGALLYSERLFQPNGIVLKHFQRHPIDYSRLRRMLNIGIATLLPMIISITLLGLEAISSAILTLFGCSMLGVLLYRLKQLFGAMFEQPLFNALFWNTLIIAPLGLLLLLLQGYALTALTLMAQLLLSLAIIAAWALLRAVVHRTVWVASHSLAYSRAASRLEAQREDKEAELPNLDLATVNLQTLRLCNSILIAGLVLALYWLWQDTFILMNYLDTLTLSQGEGVSITGLLLALLIFVATFILSRNLPGLLEISLLSRLQLNNGVSYAITSLLSYTLMATGLVWGLSTLGVSWGKLQWLVAAMGVGLGFGLQEIFANFMSGLILLFERPIRIGDTITLGELSGTVSKINIRATTITDWDHKEIIIPNKQFITQELINWTLSDPVTRITIPVGVAYGSDLELTHKLLLQAAKEHPKVLDDPEPTAYFLAFGDSTLDHELRVHVQEMFDRLPVKHAINQAIDQLFKEHHIEIAFPQRDLNLKSWPSKGTPPITP